MEELWPIQQLPLMLASTMGSVAGYWCNCKVRKMKTSSSVVQSKDKQQFTETSALTVLKCRVEELSQMQALPHMKRQILMLCFHYLHHILLYSPWRRVLIANRTFSRSEFNPRTEVHVLQAIIKASVTKWLSA